MKKKTIMDASSNAVSALLLKNSTYFQEKMKQKTLQFSDVKKSTRNNEHALSKSVDILATNKSIRNSMWSNGKDPIRGHLPLILGKYPLGLN